MNRNSVKKSVIFKENCLNYLPRKNMTASILSKAFMMSNVAKELDSSCNRMQWAGERISA